MCYNNRELLFLQVVRFVNIYKRNQVTQISLVYFVKYIVEVGS